MPVMFEQIDTEITPERQRESQAPAGGEQKSSDPAAQADRIRSELMLIEARRYRLMAD